jgi:hypothetical protein
MSISFHRDPDRDMTTFSLSGSVTLDEFIESLGKYGKAGPTHRELYNALHLKGERLSSADIEILAMYFQEYSDARRPGSKTAVVVGTEIDYGITRMISMLTEAFVNFEVEVFRSIDGATEWLAV